MRRSLPPVALLSLCLALTVPARATVMLELSVEELARTSDVVVLGRVVSTDARLERGGIVTHVRLAVDEQWVGAERGPVVELLVHGGVVGDRAQVVDGQAVFVPGEDVVVFLFAGGGALWPQGMSQGKWLVSREGASGAVTATSQAERTALVQRDARGALVPVATGRESLRLEALRARVRRVRE